ncbi:TRAP transporter small permease subunit [uncultured Ilyobacter sp.]|uniref:TRAP transporter small permease n=1 Tax=uncultured Ilyobacter sp. TaxID=544433 RepID=UPI0029C88B77|nr:TRAP transporter small permease subunit [uncultured Ilyobacter sp.]
MIAKLSKEIQKIQLGVGVACISIFFIAIVIQVFCRYAGIMVTWTGEVSEYAFTWAVFMGAGVMAYENQHFAFTSVLDKLNGKNKIILKIFISIMVLLFSVAILYYGVIITKKFWNYKWISLPEVKMGYTWLCVPLLGFTSTVYSIDHIMGHIRELMGKEATKVETGGVK